MGGNSIEKCAATKYAKKYAGKYAGKYDRKYNKKFAGTIGIPYVDHTLLARNQARLEVAQTNNNFVAILINHWIILVKIYQLDSDI